MADRIVSAVRHIDIPGYYVWGDQVGVGEYEWRVEKDGVVILVVTTFTSRKRRRNWEHIDKHKVLTTTTARVRVRLGAYEYTLPTPYIVYSGAVFAMREMVANYSLPQWWVGVQLSIWDECREAGLGRKSDAIAFSGEAIEDVCRNLVRLLRDATAAAQSDWVVVSNT
jgi:hypothetical protein